VATNIRDGLLTGVQPVKLLKMIVWRGGTRSDPASHECQRAKAALFDPAKFTETSVSSDAYNLRAAYRIVAPAR